ncbi:MAG: hypothetical protein OEY29_08695 [Gammaproteobacteria bacterium]|nr:hypothetical protein [Gammaproteobacteria bacterium]
MPVQYKIYPEDELIIVSYSGDLKITEILEARSAIVQDADFNSLFNVLDDIREVVESSIHFSDLEAIAGKSAVQTGVKRALVAESDFQFGMARMYQLLSEASGYAFKVFRVYDEALLWINSQPD